MTLTLVILILVGLAAVAYCVVPRVRRWDGATACACGYEVESLTGTDPQGPGFDGTKACPECGERLTSARVRVRGQVAKRYANKQMSFVVVSAAWIIFGVAVFLIMSRVFVPTERLHNTWVTMHRVGERDVSITWMTRDVIQRATIDGDRGATVKVEIGNGRTITVELAEADFTRVNGWARWRLRDDAGNWSEVAQTDIPDAMTTWLQKSTGLATVGENATLLVILREGSFGVQRMGEPMVYSPSQPTQHVMRRVQSEYPLVIYIGGSIAAVLWLLGFLRSMQVIYQRRTHAVTYDAA